MNIKRHDLILGTTQVVLTVTSAQEAARLIDVYLDDESADECYYLSDDPEGECKECQ